MLQYAKKNITANTGTIKFSKKDIIYDLSGVKQFCKVIVPNCFAIDCVKPPKHCWEPTVINSSHSQEFMVSRIFSEVLILLRPLMDEFTL